MYLHACYYNYIITLNITVVNTSGEKKMAEESLTLTVTECAKRLGIGRNSAYEAISRGEIPVIRVGKRLLVPKVALDRLLSGDHASTKQVGQ